MTPHGSGGRNDGQLDFYLEAGLCVPGKNVATMDIDGAMRDSQTEPCSTRFAIPIVIDSVKRLENSRQ